MHAEHVPKVHLICGFLGVGKTTALRALAAKRPPEERWAILVNEVGMIDVDGALLNATEATLGVQIETLPGGCICCTSQAPFRDAVAMTLRATSPHRLFIEPTGLAAPKSLLSALSEGEFAETVALGTVVTLVDPRRFLEPALRAHPVFEEQIEVADVLVANRSDLATDAQLEQFLREADTLRPPKAVIAARSHGDLELSWFDAAPSGGSLMRDARLPVKAVASTALHGGSAPLPDADGVVRWAHADEVASTCGWIFPSEERFDATILEAALGILAKPGPLLEGGALRIKGLVRTMDGVYAVHADHDGVRLEVLSSAADSRLEIIVGPGQNPPWGSVEAVLVSATVPRER
ncbi:MAG: CobW family GTP-binding protein [Myxococcota bacterium]